MDIREIQKSQKIEDKKKLKRWVIEKDGEMWIIWYGFSIEGRIPAFYSYNIVIKVKNILKNAYEKS